MANKPVFKKINVLLNLTSYYLPTGTLSTPARFFQTEHTRTLLATLLSTLGRNCLTSSPQSLVLLMFPLLQNLFIIPAPLSGISCSPYLLCSSA